MVDHMILGEKPEDHKADIILTDSLQESSEKCSNNTPSEKKKRLQSWNVCAKKEQ